MKLLALLIINSLFWLTGCVGTVQNSAESFTKASDAPQSMLDFEGVYSLNAISDSRIEVFFRPATGGSGKYTYDIQVGNAPFPISIPYDVLKPDKRGLLKTTLTGLTRFTTYQVKVEVRDGTSLVQSNSGVVKTATTFDNEVGDFYGISSASNTSGQGGKDSIRIRWTPARSSGALSPLDWDPISYEVIVVDADAYGPYDMDVDVPQGQSRWVYRFNHTNALNEYVLQGLPSKTTFYIRMRVIHKGSVEDLYDLKKRGEMNTNYVEISTLSDLLADIDFNPATFGVALSTGEQGLSAVQTSWTAATGVFDHYRIYYAKTGTGLSESTLPDLCLSPLLSDPLETAFCKKAEFSLSMSPVTGLEAYESYDFLLVLCATTACGVDERIISPIRTGIKLDPDAPAFFGVKNVYSAKTLEEVGNLYVEFETPNFTNGYFDGLILNMYRTEDMTDSPVEITTMSAPYYHVNYNFLADNTIVVRGVNYLETEPYCFTLHSFKWDVDGVTRREVFNTTLKCIAPKPDAPTAEQFTGLLAGSTSSHAVTLSWAKPTTGIFSHYELFWRKQSGQAINWGDAISQAGNNFNYVNYGRLLIDPDKTDVTVDGFPDGAYTFGILTYYVYVTDDGSVIKRSSTNMNFKTCTINGALLGETVACQ